MKVSLKKGNWVAIVGLTLVFVVATRGAFAASGSEGRAAASQPASASSTAPTAKLNETNDWLEKGHEYSQKQSPKKADAPASKGPPLPFHTIEGYGGGAITPMAYLVNPGPKGQIFGLHSVAFSNVVMGSKTLQAFTVTETVLDRLEFGYALDRLGLGSLPHDIKAATGVELDNDAVYLNNFNIRGLLLEENSFGYQFLPAVTAGVHFKVNSTIASINNQLDGALDTIGYSKSNGVDFTLTASKTLLYNWTLNRPLIVSAGLRGSEAASIGFLGFGDTYNWTFEGNVAYLPTDWLLVAYEFRQKQSPFTEITDLVEKEGDWQAIDVSLILGENLTLVGGWGAFGRLANSTENGGWFLQLKYEF